MRFTDEAARAILQIMKRRSLDPRKIVFELSILADGSIGIRFNQDRQGVSHKFGELTVMIDPRLESNQTVIDYGEIEGRKGIIFLENDDT